MTAAPMRIVNALVNVAVSIDAMMLALLTAMAKSSVFVTSVADMCRGL